jgi:S-DNA-T family DNA segregation ATPase FtsK/SpoIIIE
MELGGRARVVTALGLLALCGFLVTSLVTHSPFEGPFADVGGGDIAANACGIAGAYVSAYALALFGWIAYGLAGVVGVVGLFLALSRKGREGLGMRAVGFVLLAAAGILGLAVLNAGPSSTASAYQASPGLGSGMIGILLADQLYLAVGSTGTLILLALGGSLGLFLFAGQELAWALRKAGRVMSRVFGAAGRARLPRPSLSWAREEGGETAGSAVAVAGGPGDPDRIVVDEVVPALARKQEPAPEPRPAHDDEGAVQGQEFEPERERPEPAVITRFSKAAAVDDDEPVDLDFARRAPRTEYRLPPVDLLQDLADVSAPVDEAEIREKGRVLERTLREFRVEAHVVGIMRGPVITMYELSLAPGTKVSKVESLADDLAIALKAPNVRIVAPLPGKNTVGIEVPNTEREVVSVRELMVESGKKASGMAIPLFLGKDTGGHPLILDLARCPHLLVAGATGAGKSVAINAMICSILMTRTPDEVQLLLVDPKSVEFSQYAQLPHLICPVLTDMKKAAAVLKWACKKMDDRYSLLSQVGVRDLKGYNKIGEEEIRARLDPEGDADLDDVPFHMPHIVIIVDEFGELMMVAAKEVESSVIRLSQKARAVGIHLICATQRPSVDVITGLIKSNLPARIAFQVASKVDSRTILDRNGAELLLGRGDMLLLPPGSSRLVRAQGSYVSEPELETVVEFIMDQGPPQFRTELRDYHAQQEADDASDDLYTEAVRVILEHQRGSVSLLQRRLSVGYSRAARLIDMMAEAGLVGPYRGSQARQVLMTLEEWERARSEA